MGGANLEAGAGLARLAATHEILVTCGSGGVGKTTTAAAMGAMAALRSEARVLVLTVDPARRLASALGLGSIGNEATRVDLGGLVTKGPRPRGEMWAAMLDTKQSWDALVRRHAPDVETARRILANPLYQNVSGRFVQSHDYIAMERLYELHLEGNFDLIVVDTPPTRNALDFIEAPRRMAEFFSSRLLRLLIAPYQSRLLNVASRPFYQIADRILGSQFLSDIAEFFILFQTMYDGFVHRAEAVERLLRDRRTAFVVVSTLEVAPAREAQFFIRVLTQKRFNLAALVLNRVLPDYLSDERASHLAARLVEEADSLSADPELGALTEAPDQDLARVLAEVGQNFKNFAVVANSEQKVLAELTPRPKVVVRVPELEGDVHDLEGLASLGRHLWSQ